MLLRQTLAYLPAQVIGPLAQLASIVIWTHVANPQMIGIVTLVTSTQDLLVMLLLGWWTQFLMRSYREFELSGRGDLLEGASGAIVMASALVQALLAWINVKLFILPHADSALCAAVFAFCGLRAVNYASAVLASVRVAPLDYTIFSLCGPFAGLAMGVACILTFGPSPLWPLFGFAVGEGFGVVYGLVRRRTRRKGPQAARAHANPPRAGQHGEWVFDPGLARAAFAYGAPLVVAGAIAWFSINIPRFCVSALYGLDAVGRYSVGFNLGQRAASLAAMAVTVAALPLAIQRREEAGRTAALTQLSENAALLAGVMTPVLVGLWLVSPALTALSIGRAYWQSTLTLLPLSLASGGLSFWASNYLNCVFIIDRRTNILMGVEGATALAMALSVWPLTAKFGLAGAASSILLPRAFSCALLMIWLKLRRGLITPTRDLAHIGAATALMSAAVIAVPTNAGLVSLGLKICVGGIVYAGAMAYAYRNWLRARWRAWRTPVGFANETLRSDV